MGTISGAHVAPFLFWSLAMFSMRRSLVLVLLAALVPFPALAATRVTHKQVQAIKVEKVSGCSLQSIALTADGNIAALVAPDRYSGIGGDRAGAKPAYEIRIYDDTGKLLKEWPLDFSGQSLAAAKDGSLYVGGQGRVAKFDADGRLLTSVDLPHLAALLADKNALRNLAEELAEQQKEAIKESLQAYTDQIKSLEERIEKIEAKPEKERTAADKRRLSAYEQQLKVYKQISEVEEREVNVDSVMESLLARARIVNSISVTEKDVFVVTGEKKGYGYSVWRMDHHLGNQVNVLSGLSGCCGQMDVKASGDSLFVAENTKHRVGQYDRDGKPVKSFGKRSDDCFGGCCNPMNLCIGPQGNIFTAESEGIIRQFSPSGEAIGPVGKVELTGGCKNVAVAVSNDGEKVYFCDLPGSRIIVMGRVTDEKEAERLGRQFEPKPATSGLGGLLRIFAPRTSDDSDDAEDKPTDK
jgi:sugar lactone lactonase YvrE